MTSTPPSWSPRPTTGCASSGHASEPPGRTASSSWATRPRKAFPVKRYRVTCFVALGVLTHVPDSNADKGFFSGLENVLESSREARCKTALCWGGDGDTKYGLEPIGEIPVGKTFVPA